MTLLLNKQLRKTHRKDFTAAQAALITKNWRLR